MSTPPWGQEPEEPTPSPPSPPPPPNPYGGQPAPAYQPYGTYPTSPTGSPYGAYPVTPPTNGLAIASLVVSIIGALGLCCYGGGGIIGLVGAILGHVSRKQIRERQEGGDGMALAGVIVGWIAFGLGMLALAAFVVLVVIGVAADDCYYDDSGSYVCD